MISRIQFLSNWYFFKLCPIKYIFITGFLIQSLCYIKNKKLLASTVLFQAMIAANQGTFAVGGCITENSSGRIIKAMHNNALKPLSTTNKIFTFDPTAHGERQLVSWKHPHPFYLLL
jgi:cytosine deaminase